MKQVKISNAYKATVKMYRMTGVPFSICNQLFMLKKKLEPYYELQREKEEQILKEAGWDDEMIGKIPFTKEIHEAEVEWKEEPVTIIINDEICTRLGITGEIIDQLDGFIQFTEG